MLASVARLPGRGYRRLRGVRWWQWLLLLVGSIVFSTAVAFAAFAIAYATIELPDDPGRLETSYMFDADGNIIAELRGDENRIEVPLERIPQVVIDAVLSTEDRNFYDHDGVDPVGLTRALVNDIQGGAIQGGSTITQQLVKNLYLDPERSLQRKLREAILAIKVEREHDKDEILERYLNTIYFGRGVHGIEKAAYAYFRTTTADLDLNQAAFLAGLIRRPEGAEPMANPDEAVRRRNLVLDDMVDNDVLDEVTAGTLKLQPLGAVDAVDPSISANGSSAYFAVEARQWAQQHFGDAAVFGGGLRIYTTLDPRLQEAAERAVFDTLDQPDDPDAALVALDDDGAVVAMIGGKDFADSSVNLAVGVQGGGTGRQTGSTFKPVVLAAALRAGTPITKVYSGPSRLTIVFPGELPWSLENYGRSGFGALNLTEATIRSVNTAYAQLARDTGMDRVIQTAHDLGVDVDLAPFPSLTLGAQEVSVLEMARVYMTFANRGSRVTPYYVDKVTDARGEVLYEAKPEARKVYPTGEADLVNHVLSQVITRGTGRAADIDRPAAGKTGTTNDNTDAWFVGYTPKLGAAVWMGYKEDRTRTLDNVHGRRVTGGSFPAEIWQRFMSEATEDMDTGEFVPPPDDLLRPSR